MTLSKTIIQRPSPNRSSRRSVEPNCIIIHDTGGKTAESALSWFDKSESQVSSHYVTGADGVIYQCVNEEAAAWHSGRSVLYGEENVNKISIGIELVDADDKSEYPDAQIESLVELVTDICVRRRIPLNRIVGHQHIAVPPGRKIDPGVDFPWWEFLLAVGSNVLSLELSSEK